MMYYMPRITSDIPEELKIEIQNMAEDKKWSFSTMVNSLLQYAVKEKYRKKKNNSQNNPGYVGQSNG